LNFKEIDDEIKHYYDSDEDDILNDFYIKLLKRAKFYRRMTGAFSSTILAGAAKGLSHFIKNDGKMELICWASLSEKDVGAINKGFEEPNKVIENYVTNALTIHEVENKFVKDHLKALGWMVSQGYLEIKIAVKTTKNGEYLAVDKGSLGKFHPKSGLMRDENGNEICFSGSENESISGWKNNIEEFHLYKSWDLNDKKHFESQKNSIEKYWRDEGKSTKVFDFPEAARKKMIDFAPNSFDEVIDLEVEEEMIKEIKDEMEKSFSGKIEKGPIIPDHIELRDYQEAAVSEWLSEEKGILKMATGTGKTITALGLISKLYEENEKLAIVITCPYKHLVEQWKEETKNFNLNPILCYESRDKWVDELNSKINSFNMGIIDNFSLITTHRTFGMEHMQDFIQRINGENTLLVIDEVHHFGAPHLRTCLPEHIHYRLGLSATPKDWYSEERNKVLFNYFDKGIIYNYGLDKAIKNGWLTKYYYYPHIVEFTEDERQKYEELSRKISKVFSYENVVDLEQIENKSLQHLLFKRARLIGKAKNKITKLKDILSEKDDYYFNLVYCGDGKIEGERQIERVIKMMGKELQMKVHPFTAKENSKTRKNLLRRFKEKDLQALVAIRCLDEGVDVPATKNAYILASSTNPRQYIQRRGRILRKDKNKRYSYIHDFIVVPPSFKSSRITNFEVERRLIKRELNRVNWFANLAENGAEASSKLLNIKKEYNLLHL